MATQEQRSRLQRESGFGGEDYWNRHDNLTEQEISAEKRRLRKQQRVVIDSLEILRSQNESFSTKSAGEFLALHQRLFYTASHPLSPITVPDFHRFDRAYWDIPYTPEGSSVFTTQISPQLEVWSGKLSSFDLGLRALVVDMAMRVYAHELIETDVLSQTLLEQEGVTESHRNYPELLARKKAELEAQLLLAMSHSFRENYVLAVAFAKPNGAKGPRHVVGSIGAMQGLTDRTLKETVGWDGSQLTRDQVALLSSLPTNMALSYLFNEAGQSLATVPESHVVEVTRLNAAPRQVCEQLGVHERGKVTQALMYVIHHSIEQLLPDADWEIFNTQPVLHRVIRQLNLPAEVIAQEQSVTPTSLISNSIHGHYFNRTPPIPQMMRVSDAAREAREAFEVD
jgi:hypothetical protein